MLDLSTPQNFKPIKNSRKPELMAWLFSFVLIIVLTFRPFTGFARIAGLIFGSFFLISAIIISIGNWMNQKTEMRVSMQGIWFFNGVRETEINWKDINRVEINSGRFNDKIYLASSNDNFAFDIPKKDLKNQNMDNVVGFREGNLILETILDKSKLYNRQKHETRGYYYYSKE